LNFIAGRQFQYDRALEIIQEEEYLEDVDFNDIKRYDVSSFYKRIGQINTDFNVFKGSQDSIWATSPDQNRKKGKKENSEQFQKQKRSLDNQYYTGKYSLHHYKHNQRQMKSILINCAYICFDIRIFDNEDRHTRVKPWLNVKMVTC